MPRAKMSQTAPSRKPSKGKNVQRDTFAIFDLVFKKLLHLSNKAVVAFINGLFGTNYPPDATVEYPSTETVSARLGRRITDAFLKVSGVTYELEAQSTVDENIIIRIFESGFGYARDQKTFEGNIRTLNLPAAQIIQIQGEAESPQTLRLIFPDETRYDFKVEVLNLQKEDVGQTADKGMALLLPFYALKLRKQVEAARTSEERRALLPEMLALIDEIAGAVSRCEKAGVIERQDVRAILGWLKKLYDGLYGQYNELTEGVTKMKDDIKLYSDELVEEAEKRTKLEVSLKTAKRFLAMGLSPEQVAKGAGLSLAKVRALAAQPTAPTRKSPAKATTARKRSRVQA